MSNAAENALVLWMHPREYFQQALFVMAQRFSAGQTNSWLNKPGHSPSFLLRKINLFQHVIGYKHSVSSKMSWSSDSAKRGKHFCLSTACMLGTTHIEIVKKDP